VRLLLVQVERNKQPRHNKRYVKDTQRYRKRLRIRKMQAVLAQTHKLILNKSLVQLDDHDKVLLCKGLIFSSTPSWSRSTENVE